MSTADSGTTLAGILEQTVSVDKNKLVLAQQFLEQHFQSNQAEFIKALSVVLQDVTSSTVARMAAGLQIKNSLSSKDPVLNEQYLQRWLSYPIEARNFIKSNVLKTLGTETSRPSAAAQCIEYIATAELPRGMWPGLLDTLCSNIITEGSNDSLKESSLEALGYICQDIDHDSLIQYSNNILTAIIHGMKKTETNLHVRLAATNALLNSLEFTKANFEKEMERNYIMEVVCEATQAPDTQIKVAALQCLVKIMTLYYHFMEMYMAQALFPITLEAMKSNVDEVALQGIEFWSNVSDVEMDLALEISEAVEIGEVPRHTSKFYAKGALQYLVPILMEKLTQQEELDDDDEWDPSKAASVCLMLLSQCCRSDMMHYVLPFVKDNIKNTDWRFRDASLMAFASIMGGLDKTELIPMVEMAIPTIIELMYDPSVVVRDTAAWTIGRICEMTPETAMQESHLKTLLESLVHALGSEPRVATNACWAFIGLAEGGYAAAGGSSNSRDGSEAPPTYCLTPYFDSLVEKLLQTTDRQDQGQSNLRSAAYEALMEMIKNSPRDCYGTVQRMTVVILERLNHILFLEGNTQNTTDHAQYSDLEGLLCATLQSVLRKMLPEDAPKISDQIMTALIQMFNSKSGKSGGVQEDALLAVSTLVEVLGEGFMKYMDTFMPYLYIGLKNSAEYQVCLSAVGVVGDLCRALKTMLVPYCDEIMTILLQNLSDGSVDRSVKPQIFSAFADIALAIGPEFKKYLDVVLATLVQASGLRTERGNFDMVDYLNTLRESILEAYTGIIQGLKGETPPGQLNADVGLLEAHIPFILAFMKLVATDEERTDSLICACAGLVGDLCITFGPVIVPFLDTTELNDMLYQARRSRSNKTKNIGQWAMRELRKITKA